MTDDGPSDGLSTDDLRALVEGAGALAAELDLAGLLDRILLEATRLTDSPDASVLLFDPGRRRLYFAAASGAKATELLERWGEHSEQGVPVEGSKAGEVFTTGQPIRRDQVSGDADHYKGVDADTRHTTESMVCVPLAVAGKRLGVVQLLNKRSGDYTGRDLVLLEHFSAQAAIAIRNAQLFEQLLAHMGLYGSRRAGVGPAELLEELDAPPRFEQLTVLFADMRGSTRLGQVVDRPEQTFEYLNQFLGLLASTVLGHDGLVNKFLGDGVMAIFRGAGHSERAVTCAFDMVAGFDGLRAAWDDASNTPLGFLDLGIGIATDSVLLGSVGTDRVRDFTAIGVPVALAASLTKQARAGQRILVDRRTFREAKSLIGSHDAPGTVQLRSPGQETGRPFETYCIRPPGTTADAVPSALAAEVPDGPNVFVSYSHRDAAWLARLRTHLKPYLRAGAISLWDDTGIRAGDEWRREIEEGLAAAKAAVLLVSPDFLDSDFIADSELPPLLEAARARGKRILWIPVSASSYAQTEIARYQALADPSRPLDSLEGAEQNRVLVAVAGKIAAALHDAG